jgi:uncharacterized damage-inducible protein DinB
METSFSNISGIFKINTEVINRAITDVKPDDWFRKPGDNSNHLMWLLGHLVVHRGHVLKTLGQPWDSSWASLFARGAEHVGDTEYPSVEEMMDSWSKISEQLRTALRESGDVLENPAPEGPPSFDKKISGTVAFYAFHDAYHAGQVSFLRKWLGYGQTVG